MAANAVSHMRFVFASDAFKGTLSSPQTAAYLQGAARDYFPDCECVGIPMADGGEGTATALVAACGGKMRGVDVHDPLGRPVHATYGLLQGGRAVIEMAAASGDQLLQPDEKNPMMASSYGTGELISDALAKGCSDITIALGGSAAIDGGMGCMRALGARFLDENGVELMGTGRDLAKVRSIDLSVFRLYVGDARFRVMCDVTNTLLGESGAVSQSAQTAGLDPQDATKLEEGLANYADVLDQVFGRASGASVRDVSGSGAAGGLGAACIAFFSAQLQSGIASVLDLVGFDRILDGAALCVTGEGSFDAQSSAGKVVPGVAAACKAAGVPCVALVGSIGDGASAANVPGLTAVMPTIEEPMSLDDALLVSDKLYVRAAERLFALVALGAGIGA